MDQPCTSGRNAAAFFFFGLSGGEQPTPGECCLQSGARVVDFFLHATLLTEHPTPGVFGGFFALPANSPEAASGERSASRIP